MSTRSPIVKTRLKPELHARFRAELQARGLSESELLRLALCQLFDSADATSLHEGRATDEKRPLLKPNPDQVSLERKTVWMPGFLMRAACERAATKGMSFSRWVCSLVQSNLMRNPVLTETELLVIETSTRELAAIGRYLNQILRTVDAAHFEMERIRLDKLVELAVKVNEVREAVGTLIRASRQSWKVE